MALVGIPHPFDRYRGSMGKAEDAIRALASLVDWVETFNARVVFREGNEQAAELARATGLPGVAVSDAHSTLEVGVAATRARGRSVHAGRAARGAGRPRDSCPGGRRYYVRARHARSPSWSSGSAGMGASARPDGGRP